MTAFRRARSVTLYLLGWLSATACLPALLALAALVDLVARRRGLAVRLLLVAWVYLTAEVVGLACAAAVWPLALGDRERWLGVNYRIQALWGACLFAVVRWCLRLEVVVEGDAALDEPGPVLVFMRHASLIDTLLPVALVSRPRGRRLRYVLKRELLDDPCLDVVGNRLPNFFVDRRSPDPAAEVAGVRRLAEDLGPGDGVVIYPEGTIFSERRRRQALARLAERGSALEPRARRLRHVLPPRTSGPLALIEAAPEADVVVCAHRGLERFARFGTALRSAPDGARVDVRFWRIPAASIPREPEDGARWLYDVWERVDAFVSTRAQATPVAEPLA